MGDGTSSTAKFFEEFPSLLEFLVTVPGSLLMGGKLFDFDQNAREIILLFHSSPFDYLY